MSHRSLHRFFHLLSLSFCMIAAGNAPAAEPAPLAQAHAHNDYLHKRPLLDALDHGFCSAEADVFLVDNVLLVAHTVVELRNDRTLESLYLRPLAERCGKNGGWVYEPGRTVTLLVDFKAKGAETYAALKPLLEKYRQLFEPRAIYPVAAADEARAPKAPPVVVVISGDRPTKEIAADSKRLCGIDGRLSDLTAEHPAGLMPLLSDNWTAHFQWRGEGPMPDAEREKLRGYASAAHAKGARLRFWATPENEALWTELTAAGVDLIGTDDLRRLARFFSADTASP